LLLSLKKVSCQKIRKSKIAKDKLYNFQAIQRHNRKNHRTRDILYVKEILGHKRIEITPKYIDLEVMIFKIFSDQSITRVSSSVQETFELIETGSEFVTGAYIDSGKIFKKRK